MGVTMATKLPENIKIPRRGEKKSVRCYEPMLGLSKLKHLTFREDLGTYERKDHENLPGRAARAA
jgi:hypothetical protein